MVSANSLRRLPHRAARRRSEPARAKMVDCKPDAPRLKPGAMRVIRSPIPRKLENVLRLRRPFAEKIPPANRFNIHQTRRWSARWFLSWHTPGPWLLACCFLSMATRRGCGWS